MSIYTLDTTPDPDSAEITRTLDFALRRIDRPETVICYMRLPEGDNGFWSKVLRAQAENAWAEGAEAMCGQDNGGPMAENPYTVKSDD